MIIIFQLIIWDVFKIFKTINKKKTISILIIGIIAIIAINMIGSVSASDTTSKLDRIDSSKTEKLTITISGSLRPGVSVVNEKYLNGKFSLYFKLGTEDDILRFSTNGYKKVKSITLITGKWVDGWKPVVGSNGATTYKSVIEEIPDSVRIIPKNTLKKDGYYIDHSMTYRRVGEIPCKSIGFTGSLMPLDGKDLHYAEHINEIIIEFDNEDVDFGNSQVSKADLKVTKVIKKGNYHYVTVKNVGKESAGKNHLGIYVGKKKIKTLSVGSLDAGKSKTYKVLIPKKHRTVMKSFKIDIFNVIKESNKKNNSFKAK